jgi:hypothetical protein
MKIAEILKRTDKETYNKLKSMFNYKECMKRKCKDCRKKKECFKEEIC